jgi:hypothetical protein
MVIAKNDGGDPERSRLTYQGDAVDVEIERVYYRGAARWFWSLYHEARLINSGMCRGPRRARWVSGLATWWYRARL